MPDDTSVDGFEAYLKRKAWSYERLPQPDNKVIFLVASYYIPVGRNEGKTVSVAFPIPPDYPAAAPYGVHVKNLHGLVGSFGSTGGSPLGSDWQFWSRKVNDWVAGRRTASYYIDHVNLWLGGG